jgi:hypothetical protein
MLKKKKIYKSRLKFILYNIGYLFSSNSSFFQKNDIFFYENILRISTSFKQLFFSFLNTSTLFTKLFSTGQILAKQTKTFKFFKKSIFNINPLVLTLRFSYIEFFKKLYLIECLNYSKKQYLFLKKLISSITTSLRFMLFKKT